MLLHWRKSEKENAEKKKLIEKQEQERRKKEQEDLEVKRQERKLNFLLTQTELYSHFMAKKKVDTLEVANAEDDQENDGLSKLNAFEKAKLAVNEQMEKTKKFDDSVDEITKNQKVKPQAETQEFSQPKCFGGNLKRYQLEGLNWLIKLYDQGIKFDFNILKKLVESWQMKWVLEKQ
jgi:chromatin-remodeling ATPase INO80